MPKEAFDRTLARCETLLAAAEASSNIPYMESLHRELGGQVQSFRTLMDRRAELQAELKKSMRELRFCRSQAKELGSRIQLLARAAIGDSEHLSEFGIKPPSKRRPRNRPEERQDEAPRNPTLW